MTSSRPLAVITGASSGIGYELARECVRHGFDLIIAADEPAVQAAADDFRQQGAQVDAVEVDLATRDGVDALVERIGARPVRRCSPTPAMVSAVRSWIRTSTTSAMSSTPTSPGPSI